MSVVVRLIPEQRVEGKLLGRHVEHDPASRAYEVSHVSKLKAVLWPRQGGPFDQGHVGSCTGNAAAGILNTAPFYKGGPLATEADAVAIYSAATKLDNVPGEYPPTDTGSSGLAVCKVLKSEGKIGGYRHAFSARGALSALMRGPVITGTEWYEGFDRPDADGRVQLVGSSRGGHEYEVVQFIPVPGGSYLDGLVGAWNSWSAAFGKGGMFYMTVRTWAELLAQQGDVTVPLPVA